MESAGQAVEEDGGAFDEEGVFLQVDGFAGFVGALAGGAGDDPAAPPSP